jgi:hypothetical protein
MQFKISDDKSISLAEIKEACKVPSDKIYYFVGETKQDSLKKLTQTIEKLDRNIYIKKIHFSLEEQDFLYNVHII